MSKVKITSLDTLAAEDISLSDYIAIVDVSDLSQSTNGSTKKSTLTTLSSLISGGGSNYQTLQINDDLNVDGNLVLDDTSYVLWEDSSGVESIGLMATDTSLSVVDYSNYSNNLLKVNKDGTVLFSTSDIDLNASIIEGHIVYTDGGWYVSE